MGEKVRKWSSSTEKQGDPWAPSVFSLNSRPRENPLTNRPSTRRKSLRVYNNIICSAYIMNKHSYYYIQSSPYCCNGFRFYYYLDKKKKKLYFQSLVAIVRGKIYFDSWVYFFLYENRWNMKRLIRCLLVLEPEDLQWNILN